MLTTVCSPLGSGHAADPQPRSTLVLRLRSPSVSAKGCVHGAHVLALAARHVPVPFPFIMEHVPRRLALLFMPRPWGLASTLLATFMIGPAGLLWHALPGPAVLPCTWVSLAMCCPCTCYQQCVPHALVMSMLLLAMCVPCTWVLLAIITHCAHGRSPQCSGVLMAAVLLLRATPWASAAAEVW